MFSAGDCKSRGAPRCIIDKTTHASRRKRDEYDRVLLDEILFNTLAVKVK